MKSFIIICFTVILSLFTLSSCDKDFLERAPGVNMTSEKVFADPVLASQFADNSYNFRDMSTYCRFASMSAMAQVCDEATTNSQVNVFPWYTGEYLTAGTYSTNDIDYVWQRKYLGIRNCNVFLENFDKVPWTDVQDPQRIKGEQYFLRAFYYFELIKRFGGVPVFTKALGVNDNADIPRSSYEECVKLIVEDLDAAAAILPVAYNEVSGPNSAANDGRATKGAALALKSRVLLYAASPLNNTTNDVSKWQLAASASKAVMDLNAYSLQATYGDLLNVRTSPEYVWIMKAGPIQKWPDANFLSNSIIPPSSGGLYARLNPLQNHVDLYEMQATGKAIGDAGSGYNPAAPYAGRDPRFYANILYNDVNWAGRRMQMWDNGNDYKPGLTNYSFTRYYSKKYWPSNLYGSTTDNALVNYIFIRYAEILLNYAEAQNEAVGPDASVYSAVNQVRARVAMPGLPAGLSKDQMRARIINERAVELAFEDHRLYDLMRLKIAKQVLNDQKMYGMSVVRNPDLTFTYTKVELASQFQRVFTDRQYLYPIPRAEIQKSKGILKQNPGWE